MPFLHSGLHTILYCTQKHVAPPMILLELFWDYWCHFYWPESWTTTEESTCGFKIYVAVYFCLSWFIIILSTAAVLQAPYLMLFLWQIGVLSGSNFFITCADNSFTSRKCNGVWVIAAECGTQVIMTNDDGNLSRSRRRLLPATASINVSQAMEEK